MLGLSQNPRHPAWSDLLKPASAALLALALALACGGGGGGGSTPAQPASPTVTSVTVLPANPTLALGATQAFTATVAGTGSPSQAVTWSALAGQISSAGLYTAPATGSSDTVTATSVQDPTQKGSTGVTLSPPPSTVTGVRVAPASATLAASATSTFTATVSGTGSFSSAVTWSAQSGQISAAGLYTAPAGAGSDTVTATSVQDPTRKGSAAVTVTVASKVTLVQVTPASASLAFAGTQSFSAAVTGTGTVSQAVIWSAQAGQISAAGLYTAPASGAGDTVTATSVQDPSQKGSAAITLHAPAMTAALAPQPVYPVTQQAVLTPTVTGGSAPYTYAWSLNGKALTGGASLTLPSLSLGDQGSYQVSVTDAKGATASASTQVFVSTTSDLAPGLNPVGLAVAGSTLYLASPGSNQISAISRNVHQVLSVPVAGGPTGITVDPGGNLWVTLNTSGQVAKVNPSTLAITPTAVGGQPYGIALGVHNDVWFTLQGSNQIGNLPLAGGKATLYSLSSNAGPSGLSVASDGTVWFAEQTLSQVGRIAPGSSQAEEWACPNPHAYPVQILATPAGQVFYTDQNASAVVMFSAAAQGKGSAPKLAGGGGPPAAPGSGAQAAAPHSGARLQGAQGAPAVASSTLSQAFATNTNPLGGPAGIAQDAAGNVWFTQQNNGVVGQLSTSGSVTTYALPSSASQPTGIAVGPDGTVWTTLTASNQLAQIPTTAQPVTVTINAVEPRRALSGGTQTFTATVTGASDPTVTWSLLEGAAAGSITSAGVYTASSNPGLYHVIATSRQTPSIFGRLAVLVYPFTAWPQGQMTVLAGHTDGLGNADGPALSARLNFPVAACVDKAGNTYITDNGNFTVRKLDPSGQVTTFAGGPGLAGMVDGVGTAARFAATTGIAADPLGNLYVTDTGNQTIRKITPGGTVSTVAGIPGVAGSAEGSALAATFYNPQDLAIDAVGNILVADTGNSLIRKISTSGVVSLVAGVQGVVGGLDGPVASATLDHPSGIAIDAAGTLFIADGSGTTVRKLSGGTLSTLAGSYRQSLVQDGQGAAARFGALQRLTVDAKDTVYAVEWGDVIRVISAGGAVTTLPAFVSSPTGVCLDNTGNLLVTETYGQVLSRVTLPAGSAHTILVGANQQRGYQNGTGAGAWFGGPNSVAVTPQGGLLVSDWPAALRSIDPATGLVGTFAGSATAGYQDGPVASARINGPGQVVFDKSGNLFLADTDNQRIRMITPAGVVSTVAGNGVLGWLDGAALAAEFHYPNGLALTAAGTLIIGDAWNQVLRQLSPAGPGGTVSTFAGSPGAWGATPGQGGAARFALSGVMATDSAGRILVPDWYSSVLWQVTPAGNATILAGKPWNVGLKDGPLSQALFNQPYGVAIDGAGRIYVADLKNNAIRVITPGGFVATLVGDGNAGVTRPGQLRDGSDMPLGPGYAAITACYGLAVTADGKTLYAISNEGILTITLNW